MRSRHSSVTSFVCAYLGCASCGGCAGEAPPVETPTYPAGNDTLAVGTDTQPDTMQSMAETCPRATGTFTVQYASDASPFPNYYYYYYESYAAAATATMDGPTISADPMRIVAYPEDDSDSLSEQMDTVSQQIDEQEHEVDNINQDLEVILNDLREQKGLPPAPPAPPELTPLTPLLSDPTTPTPEP